MAVRPHWLQTPETYPVLCSFKNDKFVGKMFAEIVRGNYYDEYKVYITSCQNSDYLKFYS